MKLLVITLSILLSGCTYSGALRTASTESVEAYRAFNADMTDAAEAWVCRGMSIRQWQIMFGDSEEKAKAWQTLCKSSDVTPPPNE